VQKMAHPDGAESGTPKPCRLPIAGLGRGGVYLRRVTLGFRAAVEKAVMASQGIIGVYEASRIHTSTVAFRQAARIERLLAEAGTPGTVLKHDQWLAYNAALLRAKEACDRALTSLDLDRDTTTDIWDSYYANPPQLPVAPPAVNLSNGKGNGQPAADRSPGGDSQLANGHRGERGG